MSEGKILRSGFYETSYGHSHGYNSRSREARQQHYDENYKDMFPNNDIIRNKNISGSGFNELYMSHLYPRSAQVRASIQNQQGILGPGNVDSVRRQRCGDNDDIYLRQPDKDGEVAAQLGGHSQQPRTGDRARMFEPAPETRTASLLAKARWSATKTVEEIPGYRPVNYDTEYTDQHCNAARLDSSPWMGNSTNIDHSSYETDQQPLTRTKAEARDRPASARYLDHKAINDSHPSITFQDNTYPDPPLDPNNATMLDHMPQYRNARNRPATAGQMGIRNIGPPRKSRPAENFWEPPPHQQSPQVVLHSGLTNNLSRFTKLLSQQQVQQQHIEQQTRQQQTKQYIPQHQRHTTAKATTPRQSIPHQQPTVRTLEKTQLRQMVPQSVPY